jgi:hypothetical protein
MLRGSGDSGLISERVRSASIPLVHDGDDATFVNTNLLPGWLGHVKVRPWRVAPAAIVIGEGVVGRTEVCGSDGDCNAGLAKQRVRTLAVACNLVTLPARGAIIKQHGAQSGCACPVPFREEVAVTACATCSI